MADAHPSKTVGDWKSMWDERKNKYYYYHRKTRVAQWVEPEEFKIGATSASPPAEPEASNPAAPSPSDNTRSSSIPRSTASVSAKPAWKAATDTKGRVYYYNRATNETTWKKPEGFDEPTSAVAVASPRAASLAVSGTQSPVAATRSPAAATAPVVAILAEEGGEQADAGLSASKSTTQDSRGWKETTDKKSGKTYYYNKFTKETRWSPPQGWNDVVPASTFSPSSSSAPAPVPNLSAAPAPSSKDHLSGHGHGLAEPAVLSHPDTTQNAKPVWKQATDPKSGRPYWYNRETRETRWKAPDETNASVASPPSKRSESAPPRSASASASADTSIPTLTVISPTDTIPASSAVPALADWREVVDANSGRRYFYNKRSKVTQWKPPAGWVEQRALTSPVHPTPATIQGVGNSIEAPGSGPSIMQASVEPVRTPGFTALPVLPAPPAPLQNLEAGSPVTESVAVPPDRVASTPKALAGDISLASLMHVPVVTVDGTVSAPIYRPPQSAAKDVAERLQEFVKDAGAVSSNSVLPSDGSVLQPPHNGIQEVLPLPPLPQPVTAPLHQFAFASALPPGGPPSPDVSAAVLSSIPLVAAPPVSKRPDLHNLMLSHQLEVVSETHHVMGASSVSSQRSGDEQTIIQGILPLNIPGAGLTPRSAALQLSGYLWKKSRTGWKGWLKRFFVTHRWLLLYYARDSDTADAPLAVVDLRFATDIRLGHEVDQGRPDSTQLQVSQRANADEHDDMRRSKRQSWIGSTDAACLLEIEGPDVGTYTLRAADREQAVYWYQGLLAIIHRYGCVAREASVLGQRVARRFGSYQSFQDPDMLAVDAEGRQPTALDRGYSNATYLAAAYPSGTNLKASPDLHYAHHISEWSPEEESDASVQRSASASPRKVQRGHGVREQESPITSRRHIKRSVSQSAAIKWLSKKVRGLTTPNQSMSSGRKPTRVSLNAMRDPYRGAPDYNELGDASVVSSSRSSVHSHGTDEQPRQSAPRRRRVSFDDTAAAEFAGAQAADAFAVGPAAAELAVGSPPVPSSITAAEFAGIQATPPPVFVVAPAPGRVMRQEVLSAQASTPADAQPADASTQQASTPQPSLLDQRNDSLHSLSAKTESIARGKLMSAMLNSQLEEAQARQSPGTFHMRNSSPATPPNPWKVMYSMQEEHSPRSGTAGETPSKTIDLSSFLPMLLSAAQKDSPITKALNAARSPEQGASYPAQPVRAAAGSMRSPSSAPFRLLSLHQHLATLQQAMNIRNMLFKAHENPESGVGQLLLPPTTTSVVRLRTSAEHKLERCHQLLVDALNRAVDVVGTPSLSEFQTLGSPDLTGALSVVVAALRGSPRLCLSLAMQLYEDEHLEQFARLISFHILNQTSTGCASFVSLLYAAAEAARAAVNRSPGAHAAALVFLNDLIRTIPLWSYVGVCGKGEDGVSACSSWQNVQHMVQAAVSSLSGSPAGASVRDIAVASLSAFLSAAQAGQFPFDLALAIHAVSAAAGTAGARETILQGLLAPALVLLGAESNQRFGSIHDLQTKLHSDDIMNDQDVEAYISMLTSACDTLGAQIAASTAGFAWSNKAPDAGVAASVQDLQERGCFERPSELCQFCILSFDDIGLVAQCLHSLMHRSPSTLTSLGPEFMDAARRIVEDKDTFSSRSDHACNRLLRMTTLPCADFVRTTLIPGEFDAMRMMLLKFNALVGETTLLEAESRGNLSATAAIASVPALLEQDLVRAAQHLSASEPTLRVAFEEEQLWKESTASFDAVCHHLRALSRGVLPMLLKVSQSAQPIPRSVSTKPAAAQPPTVSAAAVPTPPTPSQRTPFQYVDAAASPTHIITPLYEASATGQAASFLSSPPAPRFAVPTPPFPSLIPHGATRAGTTSTQQVAQKVQHAGKPSGSLASLISGAFSPAAALRKPAAIPT